MKQFSLASVLVGLVTFAACGGSAPVGEDSSGPASSSSASSSKVVPHEQLLALLPTIPGWTRDGEPQGETDPAESVSRVQVGYAPSGPDKASSLSVEMMDTSGNDNILGPLRQFIKANRTGQTGGGSVMTSPQQVLGFPAMQEWTPEAKNGTLSILVADRFTVGITANYVSDPNMMRKVAEAIDLKKLASLK